MRVSVFTPSHNPRFLDDCYRSLAAQSFADWEWVVLLNGKASSWSPPSPDERVRVEKAGNRIRGVGAAKAAACELLTGDIFVELDHDDQLTPNALIEIVDALTSRPTATMAYSDFAQINEDGSPSQDIWDPEAGWGYTRENINGTTYFRCHAMHATPHNLGYIWYAPNHVRAFPRWAYEQVGGYNADLQVLSDQDLMIRLYLAGPFLHLQSCLYLERVRPVITSADRSINDAIQEGTVEFYRDHIEDLALTSAIRAGLPCLSLTTPSTISNATVDPRFTELTIDPTDPRISFPDDSVGVITAIDVLQRMPDRAAFLNECYRATRHGSLLLTDTPSTDGRAAFQDPSHIAFYNENSFIYLTQAVMQPTIPTLTARLQVSHIVSYFPSQVHEDLDMPYVKANLLTIKDGPRQGGPLLC